MTELKRERLKEGLTRMAEGINKAFGYTRMEETVRFETIGKKKHPEFERFDTAIREMASAFALMEADKSPEDIRVKIAPVLKSYLDASISYDMQDKDELKLKQMCLYNLALAYFWLEDFAMAESYARELVSLDPKHKGASNLIGEIQNTKVSLSKAGRLSRHG
jgi:hypothetical protein